MKQLDKVIDKCLRAINAKIPVLYLESDDIMLIDNILKSEKLATFWNLTSDNNWIQSREILPDNVIYSESTFDVDNLVDKISNLDSYDLVYNPLKSHIDDASVPTIYAIKNFGWDNQSINELIRFTEYNKLCKECLDYIILQSPVVRIPEDLKADVEVIDVINLKKRYASVNLLYAIEEQVENVKKQKNCRIYVLKDTNDSTLGRILSSSTMFPLYHNNSIYGWDYIEGTAPNNVFVTDQLDCDFSLSFRKELGRNKFSVRPSFFVTKNHFEPWLRTKENVPYVIAVKNYIPSEKGERIIREHILRVASSNEGDPIRRCIIILQSSRVKIPVGMESYVELIDVPPLSDNEIRDIIQSSIDEADSPIMEYLHQYIVNLRGFNEAKIKDILSRLRLQFHGLFTSKAIEKNNAITVIRDVKTQLLKKEGLLELIDVDKNLKVSGLDKITEWLEQRAVLFRDPIKSKQCWNLNIPKGILVSGIPGTGKSALAQQISNIFELPLLKFDFGSILNRYTGESEANMRRVFKLAEKMAPCVLWIDELEKAFSSASSSGDADGGQGKRLFGQFLTWMQEKKAACFVFATANDISKMPSEFLRRGRFDQKFYTFMPTKSECVSIFKSVMERYNSNEDRPFSLILSNTELDSKLKAILEKCAEKGKFMQGSDIDGVINDAMFTYFLNNWSYEANFSEDVYSLTHEYEYSQFFSELEKAIDNVCTYGESDATKMAICLLGLAYNKFKSASSDNNLLNIASVDYKNVTISDFSGRANKYDELLHELIKSEIDYLNEVGYNPETGNYDRRK